MSLIIEQRLDNFFFTESGPQIYTTGAKLIPMVIKKGNKKSKDVESKAKQLKESGRQKLIAVLEDTKSKLEGPKKKSNKK